MKSKKFKIGVMITVFVAVLSLSFTTNNFFEIAKQIDIYTTLFKEVNKYYVDPVNPGSLTKAAMDKMLSTLDPYTRFYDEQGVEDARIAVTGAYGGIGVGIDYSKNTMKVRSIFDDSPSAKAGIKVGDEILQVDDVVVKDFKGKSISTLLKGMPGTKINLKIRRQQKELTIPVTREKITRDAVNYSTLLENNIGYISLSKFTATAGKELKTAYEQLKNQGMGRLIIDLRGNPGGLLSEAVKIVNFFVPKGKVVVTTKGKIEAHNSTYKTRSNPLDTNMPIVVLVNNRSASASEIVSGALQDYDRAVVVGNRSFGKGLVQRYFKLPYGTQTKITISRYYIPSGRCIQKLDYSRRDKNGKVPTYSDAKTSIFYTEKGRKVYGGGGVLPDVVIAPEKLTKTAEKLLKSKVPFLYAVNYSYQHPTIAAAEKFQLPMSDFDNFLRFAGEHQNQFLTSTEVHLQKMKKTAEKEDFYSSLTSEYQHLLENIHQKKLKELQPNKQQIMDRITDEIVKCYYYEEGYAEHQVAFDAVIKKATQVLNNTDEYHKILKK